MFSLVKARDVRNLSRSVGDACACPRRNTFEQILALSAKLRVPGLIKDLLSIDGNLFPLQLQFNLNL